MSRFTDLKQTHREKLDFSSRQMRTGGLCFLFTIRILAVRFSYLWNIPENIQLLGSLSTRQGERSPWYNIIISTYKYMGFWNSIHPYHSTMYTYFRLTTWINFSHSPVKRKGRSCVKNYRFLHSQTFIARESPPFYHLHCHNKGLKY